MIQLIAGIVAFLFLMILFHPFAYNSRETQKKWREKVSPMMEKVALIAGIVMATLCGLEVYFGIQIIEVRYRPTEYIRMLLSLVPFFVCGAITSGVVHSYTVGEGEAQESIKSIASADIAIVLVIWGVYFYRNDEISITSSILTLLIGKFVWFDVSWKDLKTQVITLLDALKLQGGWCTVIMTAAVLVCLCFADQYADLFSLLSYGVIGGMGMAIIVFGMMKLPSIKNRNIKR